jgi:pimeloyl-ACP methyl ester carboxylesterase
VTDETVVLVHGLWMNGLDMAVMRQRLERSGYHTSQFSYHTIRDTPRESARRLQNAGAALDTPVLHFVCHSMGGLIIRHLYHEFPDQRPGRIVTLGTPHQPSSAALQLMRFAPGRLLLGMSAEEGLLGGAPPWRSDHELGSIAGNLRLGLGLLVPGIPRPNDGTVAVEETRLDGMKDHVIVHASHFGLLFSREAERAVEHFLRTGTFGE